LSVRYTRGKDKSSFKKMNKKVHILTLLLLLNACYIGAYAQNESASRLKSGLNQQLTAIEKYLAPYIQTSNFSGTILIENQGKTILEKSYGLADRELGTPNSVSMRFHIASMSMQFTAAAILRLVDEGKISLDEHIADFVPEIEGATDIRIRDLLNERSGLPDINGMPDYDEILKHHQTPESLVTKIEGKPLLFPAGTKFLHEEHSAYNLLALIIQKKTGLTFAAALKKLVFLPLGMDVSGADDDSISHFPNMAKGYETQGTYGLKDAANIHWSGKTGNGSVYTTATDEARWINALFEGRAFSKSSQYAMLDTTLPIGYGWFKKRSSRYGQFAYYMNGRAPGFSSFVLYLPDKQTAVIVLSNIYSSATTTIGYDVAAILFGLPYQQFQPKIPGPQPDELKLCAGTFQFEANFYQPNAKIALLADGPELNMRWPSGDVTPMIPLSQDHFLDRAYWVPAEIKRDTSGRPGELIYDSFKGKAIMP
jgi:CubicO group peptidase (beta-lactamase class C family)